MRNLTITLSLFSILVFFMACLTKNKALKKIEIGYFSPNTNSGDVFISGYIQIKGKEQIACLSINSRNKETEYVSVFYPDTIYSVIEKLFNNARKLKKYEVSTKLAEDEFFSGKYFYIRVEYDNYVVDSLCTIKPFLNDNFNSLFGILENHIYKPDYRIQIPSFEIPSDFFQSLNRAYSKNHNLPAIRTLPPLNK